MELMALHLSSDRLCRWDRIEEDLVQKIGPLDPSNRLILTESLFLKISGDEKKVTMFAVPVQPHRKGEIVMVDTWYLPSVARRELEQRRAL